MTREEALVQLKDVLEVINQCLEQAEDICNDQLSYPVKIDTAVEAAEARLGVDEKKEKWIAPVTLVINYKADRG